MWSGPRNLSTAMMRSFGNRTDCAVADEPFYAAYLSLTGLDHPMRAEILRHHETDWRKVAAIVSGPAPSGKPLFYQKHMTHHMLPEIGRDWMRTCRHAFLIRHPARVLASYAAKREAADAARHRLRRAGGAVRSGGGFFRRAAAGRRRGGASWPIRRACCRMLCEALEIPFSDAMLAWPPGPRDSDGVWAAHWYDAVNRSTGFGAPSHMPSLSDPALQRVEAKALPIYERLSAFALT